MGITRKRAVRPGSLGAQKPGKGADPAALVIPVGLVIPRFTAPNWNI